MLRKQRFVCLCQFKQHQITVDEGVPQMKTPLRCLGHGRWELQLDSSIHIEHKSNVQLASHVVREWMKVRSHVHHIRARWRSWRPNTVTIPNTPGVF